MWWQKRTDERGGGERGEVRGGLKRQEAEERESIGRFVVYPRQ
jgi:hypothetical protein